MPQPYPQASGTSIRVPRLDGQGRGWGHTAAKRGLAPGLSPAQQLGVGFFVPSGLLLISSLGFSGLIVQPLQALSRQSSDTGDPKLPPHRHTGLFISCSVGQAASVFSTELPLRGFSLRMPLREGVSAGLSALLDAGLGFLHLGAPEHPVPSLQTHQASCVGEATVCTPLQYLCPPPPTHPCPPL